MHTEITVNAIRSASPEFKLNLILKYVNDAGEDTELSPDEKEAALDVVAGYIAKAIALDEWSALTFVPIAKGYNAYDYLHDYYGLDSAVPLSTMELFNKYPKLFHSQDIPENIDELAIWYNSITISVMAKIAEDVEKVKKENSKEFKNLSRIEKREVRRKERKESRIWEDSAVADYSIEPASIPDEAVQHSMAKAANSLSSPIFNPWILPGKFDEFMLRRRERMDRLSHSKNERW